MENDEIVSLLLEAIGESEHNGDMIYQDIESMGEIINSSSLEDNFKNNFNDKNMNALMLLQNQDMFRQKIEKALNAFCDSNNIDKSSFNIAPSAKNIDHNDDNMTQEELEALLKSM